MASFDDLPADQKAVLQLVLRQGRTYDELAELLRISPAAVRDRALNGLDSLVPEASSGLSGEGDDDLSDFLLGQQSASRRAATRTLLETAPGARARARSIISELRDAGLEVDAMIPADDAEMGEAFDALEARQHARADRERSSRLGGALILIAAGIIAIGAILILTGQIGGDGNDDGAKVTATTTATAGTSTTGTGTTGTGTSTTDVAMEGQVNFTATDKSSKALAVANIVSQDGKRAIAILGQDLPASGFYALWLYSSPTKSRRLGFFPPVSATGDTKGRLTGLVSAPSDLSKFRELIITRESTQSPKTPGPIVLRGPTGGA